MVCMPDPVTVGLLLRRYRERAGLTQEAVAAAIESTQTTISLAETGGRGVGLALLRRMAGAYAMTEAEVGEVVMLASRATDPAGTPTADAESARG